MRFRGFLHNVSYSFQKRYRCFCSKEVLKEHLFNSKICHRYDYLVICFFFFLTKLYRLLFTFFTLYLHIYVLARNWRKKKIIIIISNWTMCRTIQRVIVLVISNWPRARPILKLLAQLLPELYSTRTNYYY